MDQKGASGSRSNRLVTLAQQAAEKSRRSNIIEDMAKICEADRQTSSFVERTQGIKRPSVDNSVFVAVEDLILASAEPTPEERVRMIMLDFCSSPTYTEDEDEPNYESEPWFRFRRKRIKTYGRKRDSKGHMVMQNEEPSSSTDLSVQNEEPSSSSDLSVQRDPNTSSTSVACDFDAAASQRIHEVLLNLSQYFSGSGTDSSPTPSAPSKIDLPNSNLEDECLNTEVMNLRDDLLENGFTFETSICDNEQEGTLADTLFGDSRQAISITHPQLERGECKDWSDADSTLQKSEKMSSDDETAEHKNMLMKQMKAEHPVDEKTNLILEGIPMSEWQTPMELPTKSKEVIKHIPEEEVKLEPSSQKEQFRALSNKESDIAKEKGGAMVVDKSKQHDNLLHDGDLLQEFLFNEWHPINCSDGPSTSNAIKVPKKKINLIKPDVEQPEKKTPNKSQSIGGHQIVGFRKTPYKFIQVSEEMKIRGEKFVAQVVSDLYQSSQKCNSVSEECSAYHSQVMASIECERFKTALSKPIETLDVTNKKAKLEVREINAKCSPLKNESIAELEFSGFRTASNKAIVISEKMKMRTAEFMAEFQSAESNQQNAYKVNQPNDKKTIEISEEIPSKASKLVVDNKMEKPHEPTNAEDCRDSNESTFMGFRTASNKAIEVTEAMEKRGAMFLAQSKAADQQDAELIEELVFSEWQLSDLADVASTSNNSTVAPKINSNSINVEKSNTVDTKTAIESEFFGFRTASNKGIVISESTKAKAAQFMSEFQAFGPSTDSNQPIVIPGESKRTAAKFVDEVAAEDSPNKAPFCDVQSQGNASGIEHFTRDSSVDRSAKKEHPRTPKRSQEIHSSLSQLAGISPLDQATKKSVIERRNILTLKRKRKITSSTATSGTCASPAVDRFAPMPAATSTPLAARNSNLSKDCAKDRQSVEDMSPICMQPRRSRRLGLSGRRS
ncbi:breast cancer type 2 susceptibility protein homolog isoform X2 [Drosophila teissieri]|uniref:breast cancer type 2 susceptibility protein homolog isoform X2 n=1 Tax=Drosophila teissieri TaxID=7243 RepID=UPI001CBA2DA7|nr:breast cancer type 2 susceptibility protein homolog isoform X2 [Drosophila teissieri]